MKQDDPKQNHKQLITTLLSREEAASFLGVKKSTLEVWSCSKRYHLPYVKIGRLVRYKLSDLHAFIDRRTLTGGVCHENK
jgi:excisionase family DNA binding protein